MNFGGSSPTLVVVSQYSPLSEYPSLTVITMQNQSGAMNYSGNTTYRPDHVDGGSGDHHGVEMVGNHVALGSAGRRSPTISATFNQTRDSCSPQRTQGPIRVEVSKRRIGSRGDSPQRVIPIVHSKSPSGISLHSNPANMASPGVNTSVSRTVTVQGQSTNYQPNEHGLVNNQVLLTPQMVIAPQNSVQNKTIFVSKSGSTYSSPRSSTGSYDSKGSSPRTSIVNPSQPTYDYQRHGSPRSSIVSSRSSISGISFDSKQSSPRTSVTSIPVGITLEKYTSQQQHGTNANSDHARIVHEDNRVSVTIRGHPGMLDRFNEPAPPPPYNAKMMANAGMYLMQPCTLTPWYGQKPQVFTSATGEISFKPHHVSPNQIPPNVPHKAPTKLRGLHYEVIPPKRNGPSEAEKKLAVLTKKLESEMCLSADSTSLSSSPQKKPSSNPPPYYGPHITGTNIHCYSTAPAYANSDIRHVPPLTSASATLASSKLDISSNSLKMALPVVVTPPHPHGPTEAEKKLEALTQELESQLEQNPQGEYYGKCIFNYQFIVFV